ncbi:unnamed protein product, partial [Bubo scandiacus]
MAAPGLERHRLALLAAREDVGNPRAGTDWAIFAYEKHHDLKLLDSGAGGPDELAEKFLATSIMYGLCRVPDPGTGAHRIVLISWVGEKAPEPQRQACAGHLPAIRAFFREASVVLSARRAEEVTREGLSRALAQLAPPVPPALARKGTPPDTPELVGTNYRKTNPALEIHRTKRDSFWAQAEREEEQRREEERRRALEERRRWERERMEEERREAAERELRCREKERVIEEQRAGGARGGRGELGGPWGGRGGPVGCPAALCPPRSSSSGSTRRPCGTVPGAASPSRRRLRRAVLVSQRSQNPRDFFRQRERSGSTSGTPLPPPAPGTRPGARRPFLCGYQRSLTESAFIFRRPDPPPLTRTPPARGLSGLRPPPAPAAPQPPLPSSPAGRGTPPCAPPGSPPTAVGSGTPQCATTGTPMGTGTPPCAPPGRAPSPVGIGTPQSVTTEPLMGTGTHPSGPPGSPPSPVGTGTPQSAPPRSPPSPVVTGTSQCATTGTPMGTETPPCAPLGTPPSPATAGPPHATSPTGTPPCAAMGTPPQPSPPGSPPRAPRRPLTLPLPSPPSTPKDEDGPPPGHLPPPQPPPGMGVSGAAPGWDTPPPAPPSLTQDPQPGGWPGPPGLGGHNGIGGHEEGIWPPPWEQDPPSGQGDEPSDSVLLPQPLHKARPGFALLLARDAPHPAAAGGHQPPRPRTRTSPPTPC